MQHDNKSKVPINIDELQRRIRKDFRTKYSEKQSNELAANMTQYLIYHQFDEWQDIVDDINNGYHDCCCKEIVFKQLNITNIKQKHNEYLRLKQCLNPAIFAQIFQDIFKVFSIIFNAEIADNVLKLFSNIINTEEFDIDDIKDDVDEIESSTIISYVIDEIDFNQINQNKEKAQNMIANTIQLICKGQTNKVIKQYEIKRISLTDKVEHEIVNAFIHKFNKDVTKIIVSNTFNHMIHTNQFYNPHIIIDDLQNANKSKILNNISNATSISQEDYGWIARTIIDIIDEQLIERKRFDITQNIDMDTDTITAVKEYCSIIYEHADDIKNNEQDNGLIIAKSLDTINKYPLLMWFIDLFGRDRIKGHKENYLNKLSYHKDRFATNYDVQKWWINDNKLCKYITKYYPKTASIMIEAIKLLTKRILPPLNVNHVLANTICDSLNDFAKYTLSSHSFAHKIVAAMSNSEQFQFVPVQFDIWIIPQATAPSISYQPSVFELEQNGTEYANTLNRGKRVYNEMGKYGSFDKAQNAFWNLEGCLKKDKYVKNEDYIVEEVNNDLDHQMFSMFNSKTLNLSKKRYNRYIFIIDRRNPENIKDKNMGHIEPKIDIPDKNGYINNPTKTWNDRIYFILPKVYHKLPSKCELFPEQCLVLSAKYLFPNPEKHKSDPIKILDAFNGYKFVLSYHLFSENNCSTYWYINQGSIKFELQYMKWLWSRYFDKVNNWNQELSEKIINDIDHYNIYKQVRSDDFDEFMTQSECECELQRPLKSQGTHPTMKTIQDITKYIKEYFVNQLNDKQIGHIISESFKYIINEEEFDDLQTVKDDMDDMNESVILPYIIQQIEPKLGSLNKQKQITMIKATIREIVMKDNKQKYNKIKANEDEYEKLKIKIKYKEKTIKKLNQQLLDKEEKHKQDIEKLIESYNEQLEKLRKALINMNEQNNKNKQEIKNLLQCNQMSQAIMHNEKVFFK